MFVRRSGSHSSACIPVCQVPHVRYPRQFGHITLIICPISTLFLYVYVYFLQANSYPDISGGGACEITNKPSNIHHPQAFITVHQPCPHLPSIFPPGLLKPLYEPSYSHMSSGVQLIPCESGQWHETIFSVGEEEVIRANVYCIVQRRA